MKTAESFQATYVATSLPKTVSLLEENQDDLRQEFLEFVFSDCLLQETIIDNCNKLFSVESILETLCGMVTIQ